MGKSFQKTSDSDLGYGSVIYNLMVKLNSVEFNEDRSNSLSLIQNIRLRVTLLRAMLSPFDGDEEFQVAIKNIKYTSSLVKCGSSDKNFDDCVKMYAALIQLAFKYQLVQPYQEELVDDIESNELDYNTTE